MVSEEKRADKVAVAIVRTSDELKRRANRLAPRAEGCPCRKFHPVGVRHRIGWCSAGCWISLMRV